MTLRESILIPSSDWLSQSGVAYRLSFKTTCSYFLEERILLRFFETILLAIVSNVNRFYFKKTFQFFRFYHKKILPVLDSISFMDFGGGFYSSILKKYAWQEPVLTYCVFGWKKNRFRDGSLFGRLLVLYLPKSP